jgi:hypothetical protein
MMNGQKLTGATKKIQRHVYKAAVCVAGTLLLDPPLEWIHRVVTIQYKFSREPHVQHISGSTTALGSPSFTESRKHASLGL